MPSDVPIAPCRIQRSRAKGWRMPEGAIYVGRPTCWGNPFAVSGCSEYGRAMAVAGFRMHVKAALARAETPQWVQDGWYTTVTDDVLHDPLEWLRPLRGHDLACWCPLTFPDGTSCPCHADVLLEIANAS
jgi:hypothetical protein